MNTITRAKFGYLTIGAIPSSYMASMTYEEQLLYLLAKLDKELIPALNELIKEFSEYDANFEEIYQKLDTLQSEIDLFNDEVNSIKSSINNLDLRITTNENDIILLNSKITNDINNLRNELIQLVNDDFNTLRDYVDYHDSILNEKIDNIQIGLINIYDPTTGVIEPLQIVINNLYQLTNKDGLTASEFDALDLTATAFDTYQITAYEFDSAGKTILV